jgi:hypothetical protein
MKNNRNFIYLILLFYLCLPRLMLNSFINFHSCFSISLLYLQLNYLNILFQDFIKIIMLIV